jgi:SOS-response transcriptional repressor LexA
VNPALIKQGEERRTAILHFVRDFVGSHGFAPNIAEIAKGVDLAAPNGVRLHLRTLQEEGYLTVQPKLGRAISLTSPAPDGWTR